VLITTLVDDKEIHPDAFVTVKVYVPVANPETVVLGPLPVMAPGLMVQSPAGKPFNTTLPVATEQVGWVIVPIAGAAGVPGFETITISADAGEVHPAALVTV